MKIGKIQELTIEREVDFGCYLTDGEDEVLIPRKYLPEEYALGDTLTVFVYTDHESRPVAVTRMPKGQVGDIVGLEIKQITDFGAFADNGLEKDLLIPKKEQWVDVKEGGRYPVKILLDYQTQRMIGSTKVASFLLDADPDWAEGQEIQCVVWQATDLGFKVIINSQSEGLIYHDEIFEDLNPGDNKTAYIKKIREDGKIDVSLQKQGYQAVMDLSGRVLQAIEQADGILPLGDKSSPEEIKSYFCISKKNFKKILGGLYKMGKVEIFDYEVHAKSEG